MRRVDLNGAGFEYDGSEPERFRSGAFRAGKQLGAERTGATLWELQPGRSICPYHYEYGEEEWLLVIEGEVTVRTPDATEQLGPMQLVFFPTGPEGAHEVRNDGDATARVLMWSELVTPTATAYPDSGKVGVYTADKSEDGIFLRSSSVDYFEGEGR